MLDSQAHETIIQKAMADRANAESMLAREVEKRTDAQASIQAISGLLQDGMANTMNALRHWEHENLQMKKPTSKQTRLFQAKMFPQNGTTGQIEQFSHGKNLTEKEVR